MAASSIPHASGSSGSGDSAKQFRARITRYRMLFRKYWPVVAFMTALGVGTASWFVARQKVTYFSTARMMVSGKINLPEGGAFAEEMTFFMATQGELMRDEAVRTRAEARVRTTSPETPIGPIELEVIPIKQTSIFSLTAIGAEPKYPHHGNTRSRHTSVPGAFRNSGAPSTDLRWHRESR